MQREARLETSWANKKRCYCMWSAVKLHLHVVVNVKVKKRTRLAPSL